MCSRRKNLFSGQKIVTQFENVVCCIVLLLVQVIINDRKCRKIPNIFVHQFLIQALRVRSAQTHLFLAHLSRSDKVSFCDQSPSVRRLLTIDFNDNSS